MNLLLKFVSSYYKIYFEVINLAVPRVFISSTFYDLKEVRTSIKTFIESLGYDPIMHEYSSVTYTQNTELENDCYHELSSCEIVVCIIGNHFGTTSSKNQLSITMNEIDTAIKQKKKIYIFISQDVFIENRTYIKNKGNGEFKSAYTDDIRIHEYIEKLRNETKNHVIESFETTEDIVSTLRKQFAGLFQALLIKDTTISENKSVYDLQETADKINNLISIFQEEKEEFFHKFDGSIFAQNKTLRYIQSKLGIINFSLYVENLPALDELMSNMGFDISEDNQINLIRIYKKYESQNNGYKCLSLNQELFFEDDYSFKDIRKNDLLNEYINVYYEEDIDDDLPF